MRSSRDRLVLKLFSGAALIVGCSRLTAIDWTQVPVDDTGGTSSGATNASGAAAGEDSQPNPGGSPSGEAGEGGEAGASGGEAGSTEMGGSSFGGSSAGFGGRAGAGGRGGAGGMSGSGGASGGGSAGSAGSGGGDSGPPACTGVTSPVTADDLVLFDGGPGKENTAWGGREGLDDVCKAGLAKLSIPQKTTHAFISVDATYFIGNWTTQGQLNTHVYNDISLSSRVVSVSGIQLASSYSDLLDSHVDQSLVCAGVVAPTVKYWLTGSQYDCITQGGSLRVVCGQYNAGGDPGGDTCAGWTLGSYDAVIQARYGLTDYTDQRFFSAAVKEKSFLKISCNKATYNVLCMAYNPQP